jgi:hypothetical protein
MGGSAMNTPISLAALLERFFTQRLMPPDPQVFAGLLKS